MVGSKYKKGLCSICCLGYKHAQFLEQNIRAIWDNDYKNVEIIAIDDGSNDSSIEKLKELQQQSPCPLIVIEQENTGNIGKNFNTAFKEASGEYVSFISLDDVLARNSISEKMAIMNNDHNVAFVANAQMLGIDNHENIKDIIPPLKLNEMENVSSNDLLELEYNEFGAFYIQGNIFRSDLVEAFNAFDEDMTGDDIVFRTKMFLYLKNNPHYNFKILKSAACYYRIHDNNVHKNTIRQMKIVTEYLERYWNERENPKILIDWALHAVKTMQFEEYMKIFALNSRSASLLLDSDIQQSIKKSIYKSIFYKKEKLEKNIRKIILLSFFKFQYSKAKK